MVFSILLETNEYIPLFKKGESNIPINYGPVSLLSCIRKMYGTYCIKTLDNFLLVRNLIYEYQSGFQAGHSTVYQLIEIYDGICKNYENRGHTCMVFCYVSKSFDLVRHDGIIHKLQAYGFMNIIVE